MFLAHYGIALGAKRLAPNTSLGTLFLASAFIDLLWPTLLLVGIEEVRIAPGITRVTPLDFSHYPYSHSLLAVLVWGLALGALYRWRTGYVRGAWVVGAVVVSHWWLDVIVHRPDLPLYPGTSTHIGLGLWNSLPGTLFAELLVLVIGFAAYLRFTRAVDRTGIIALWALVLFLLLIFAGNLAGEPPPNAMVIGLVGQTQWLLVAWAYWIERHRALRAAVRTNKQEVILT